MTENMDPKDPTGLRYYGSDMTIHTGGEVDIELDGDGKVVAVWFRCQPLPFTQAVMSDRRAEEMRQMYAPRAKYGIPSIEAVVLRDE